MKLKKPLPPNCTVEQLFHHYQVEKAIAERLKRATREERKRINATMYDELFRQVPYHSRLMRITDEETTRRVVQSNLTLLKRFLNRSTVLIEFAPGDCKFAMAVAPLVQRVYGIDLCDQHSPKEVLPSNLTHLVYDGYSLEGIRDNSADIVFSDQLIEHIHPEDTRLHFELAYRLLKRGGRYIFQTPHALNGPHDVSGYFSDTPEGFHLKEWTCSELEPVLRGAGYSQVHWFWFRKQIVLRMPSLYFAVCERTVELLPQRIRRSLFRFVLPTICCAAAK